MSQHSKYVPSSKTRGGFVRGREEGKKNDLARTTATLMCYITRYDIKHFYGLVVKGAVSSQTVPAQGPIWRPHPQNGSGTSDRRSTGWVLPMTNVFVLTLAQVLPHKRFALLLGVCVNLLWASSMEDMSLCVCVLKCINFTGVSSLLRRFYHNETFILQRAAGNI